MFWALQETRTETRMEWLHAPAEWLLILGIVPLVLLFVAWIYRGERGNLTLPRRLFLGFLRVAVLFLIIAFLCEPILRTDRVQRENSYILVLIDDSYSMGIEDRLSDQEYLRNYEAALGKPFVDGSPRLSTVVDFLSDEQVDFIERLREKANVRVVACSDGLQQVRDFARRDEDSEADPARTRFDLKLRGKETRLGDSIYEAVNDLRGEMVAGVVLFSDGRDNGGVLRPEEVARRLRKREIPIHTVGVGNPEEPKDVRVFGLDIAEVVLKDDVVPVDFNLISDGFEGRKVEVKLSLRDTETGRTDRGTTEFITLVGNGEAQPVRLEFKPTREGRFRVFVEVERLDGEIFEDNNRAEALVTVLAQKIKVLYVDGPPRWEYRFLTWSLTRDPTMECEILLLSADPEWIPESSPGIDRPRREFPRSKEELFDYHLVILGDIEPNQLATTQKEWLVEFVDDMGGGVVFLAGPWYMPQKFRGDPLEKLLPIELADSEPSFYDQASSEFHVKLTPEGRDHPVMQLDPDPDRNLRMWQKGARSDLTLPGFYWYAKVKKLKRGGVALAVHEDGGSIHGPRPIFAYQYFGRGRTFISLVDSTWRWRRFRGKTIFYRFWGQVFRFASAGRLLGKTQRFSISTDQQEYTLGSEIKVLARALDRNFKPTQDEERTLFLERVDPPSDERKELNAAQVPARPEYYEMTVEAQELGEHRVWLEDREAEVASASYRVVVPQLEYAEPRMDRPRLKQIAERSGGAYHEIYEAPGIPDRILPVERPILISSEQSSLWDRWMWLVLAVALLTVEWIARKVWRLL